MSITVTTLSGAKALNDLSIAVASATGSAVGNVLRIDNEYFYQPSAAVGTNIPVTCGKEGQAQVAHNAGARVFMGLPGDFPIAPTGTDLGLPYAVPATTVTYNAAGAIAVPTTIRGHFVELLSGAASAMTIGDPTAAVEGTTLTIMAMDAEAYTVTNTTGFNGGSTASDVATFGGAKGDNFTIRAVNAQWFVVATKNVTFG